MSDGRDAIIEDGPEGRTRRQHLKANTGYNT